MTDYADYGSMNEVKVSSFTRNTATASGTQAVTGIGFKPRAVFFIAAQDSVVGELSFGFDDGVTPRAVRDYFNVTPDAWETFGTYSISILEGAGKEYEGNVDSFDSDGFTIDWTRTGAPVGTVTVIYLAIK